MRSGSTGNGKERPSLRDSESSSLSPANRPNMAEIQRRRSTFSNAFSEEKTADTLRKLEVKLPDAPDVASHETDAGGITVSREGVVKLLVPAEDDPQQLVLNPRVGTALRAQYQQFSDHIGYSEQQFIDTALACYMNQMAFAERPMNLESGAWFSSDPDGIEGKPLVCKPKSAEGPACATDYFVSGLLPTDTRHSKTWHEDKSPEEREQDLAKYQKKLKGALDAQEVMAVPLTIPALIDGHEQKVEVHIIEGNREAGIFHTTLLKDQAGNAYVVDTKDSTSISQVREDIKHGSHDRLKKLENNPFSEDAEERQQAAAEIAFHKGEQTYYEHPISQGALQAHLEKQLGKEPPTYCEVAANPATGKKLVADRDGLLFGVRVSIAQKLDFSLLTHEHMADERPTRRAAMDDLGHELASKMPLMHALRDALPEGKSGAFQQLQEQATAIAAMVEGHEKELTGTAQRTRMEAVRGVQKPLTYHGNQRGELANALRAFATYGHVY